MKKAFAFLCVCLSFVVLCTSAMGDPFVLRNGIEFGDTMETILQKETTLVRESETNSWFEGEIAGYPKAMCGFYFDDDGKLISMDYSFDKYVCTSEDIMKEVYDKFYQSLNNEYGDPFPSGGGICYVITGPAMERMNGWLKMVGTLPGFIGEMVDYAEWIEGCENGHVKIELVAYYTCAPDNVYDYHVDISYHLYTEDDYDMAISENHSEYKYVNSIR